jgi:hypothetical protein
MDNIGLTEEDNNFVLNESVVKLNEAWCTETNAPDILTFRADIVEKLQRDLRAHQVRSFCSS